MMPTNLIITHSAIMWLSEDGTLHMQQEQSSPIISVLPTDRLRSLLTRPTNELLPPLPPPLQTRVRTGLQRLLSAERERRLALTKARDAGVERSSRTTRLIEARMQVIDWGREVVALREQSQGAERATLVAINQQMHVIFDEIHDEIARLNVLAEQKGDEA